MDNVCSSSRKTSSHDSERMKGEKKALWKVKGKQIVDEDLAPSAIVGRSSLPRRIQKLKETSFSLLVSNIPEEMSKVEPKAMFCRAGKILDVFIPMEKHSRRERDFAFVRFGIFHEAEKAVEMARGRSWGGRKIQAQLSRFKEEKCLAQKETSKNVSNVLIQKPPFSASSCMGSTIEVDSTTIRKEMLLLAG